MYVKQRQLPLEVSSWMQRDVTMRKVTANSRLMTNDTRQNVVLSRRFFTDLFALSMNRYRKINESNHNQRRFLRQQIKKSQTSMPGLRPYVDQMAVKMNHSSTFGKPPTKAEGSDLNSTSIQSFAPVLESKSEPVFNRRQKTPQRQTKTAEPLRTRSDIIPLKQPPSNPSQNNRERILRLAQPRGTKINPAGTAHIRSNIHQNSMATEELFNPANSEVSVAPGSSETKFNSMSDDRRFRSLVGTFSEIHERRPSRNQSVQKIVAANPSLHDDEGRWNKSNQMESDRKADLKRRRQMLITQLHKNIDIFLIEVGA